MEMGPSAAGQEEEAVPNNHGDPPLHRGEHTVLRACCEEDPHRRSI